MVIREAPRTFMLVPIVMDRSSTVQLVKDNGQPSGKFASRGYTRLLSWYPSRKSRI